MDDWVRVRLGRVGGEVVATPLPRGAGVLTSLVRADGLLVVPAGLEGHHAGEEVEVELLRGLDEVGRTIVAIGSHDLVLDLAASALRERDPRLTLVSRTSARSAAWSRCGTACATWPARTCSTRPRASTPCRTSTGCSARRRGVVVRLVHRQQGLLVAPGNPLGLAGDRGPDPARPALRQPAARRRHPGAARPRAGPARARPGGRRGLRREESTHLAVARRGRVRPGRRRAWGSWPPRAPSASTSCRWPRSPTTSSPRRRSSTTGVLDPLLDLIADPGVRARRSRRSAATPPPRPAGGSGRKARVSIPFPEPTQPATSRTEVLLGYLDYFRAVLRGKVAGLDEDGSCAAACCRPAGRRWSWSST